MTLLISGLHFCLWSAHILILIKSFLGFLGFNHYIKKQIFCPIESVEDSVLPFQLRVYSFTPVFPEVFDLSGGGVMLTAFLCWDPAVPEWSWHPIRVRAHGPLAVFLHTQLSSTAFSLWTGFSAWCGEVSRFYSLASSWSRVAPWPTTLTCRLARAGGSVTFHNLLSTFQCKLCSSVHSRKIFFFFFFTS